MGSFCSSMQMAEEVRFASSEVADEAIPFINERGEANIAAPKPKPIPKRAAKNGYCVDAVRFTHCIDIDE